MQIRDHAYASLEYDTRVYLTQAGIYGFRNLLQVELHPASQFNLLTGANGAGKSSVLEAIHLLSTGHSFRTRKIRELIMLGAEELSVTAQLHNPGTDSTHRAGVRKNRAGETELKLDYSALNSTAEMARLMPVKALSPDSHRLMQEGPANRRQFIDWGLFHVEPGFFTQWKVYRRALEQRNQSLRSQLPDVEVMAWNTELADSGQAISDLRSAYVESLVSHLSDYLRLFSVEGEIRLTYKPGWSNPSPLAEALPLAHDQCRRFKTTTVGPHRAELNIDIDQVSAKQIMSRGQQKLLVYALHFAQLSVFREAGLTNAIVLCDDLPAELDDDRLQRVLSCLSSMDLQVFISSNRPIPLPEQSQSKTFHVEHGKVLEVV